MAESALLPWLLLLSRLMVLRGKLLGHLLANEADGSGKAGATSALHTAYGHVKMAHESASTLAAQLKGALGAGLVSESDAASQQHQHLHQQREHVQAELQLRLLPALKQAVQVLRAAMKLSRHYHETGFASGFAAGFAAGYAAAVAAASGVNGGAPAAALGPVSFASPWGVLQQGCIRGLPQQLEEVGTGLSWQLRHCGCSNPLCVNLSLGSELWLVPQGVEGGTSSDAAAGQVVAAVAAGDCSSRQAKTHLMLCSSCSKALAVSHA